MKVIKIGLSFSLFLFAASLQAAWQDIGQPTSEWEVAYQEDRPNGLLVETRFHQDSRFRMFRARMQVPQSLAEVLQVIEDSENSPLWFYNLQSVKALGRNSEGHPLRYSVSDMPWPVMDRDSVTLASKTINEVDRVRIDMKAQPDAYPVQADKVRVPMMQGFWGLEALPNQQGMTLTFEMMAEPGGVIPSWLVNQLVEQMPRKTFENLRAYLQEHFPK